MNKEESIMYVQNLYDAVVNIQENRGISYGEIVYIQNLNKKELYKLENELLNELQRIYEIVIDYI